MDFKILQEITNNFTDELTRSAKGEKTSLPFIKNTIPASPLVKDGETFQVMIIGGTNFFKALLTKAQGNLKILTEEHDNLPIFPDKKTFFSYLEKQLDPTVSVLAITFGFAIEPTSVNGKLEAIFLISAKESTFTDLIGKNICVEFEKYMKEKNQKELRVSIANDTICLLLSGLTQNKDRNLAAGIVGTGTNFAMFLNNTTLINLESGMFAKFPHTEFFDEINQSTNNPTDHFYEKEIAGGYLYMHFNMWLKKENKDFPPLISTQQLSQLAIERQDEFGEYAKMLLQRSGQLVACIIAGILKFKQTNMTFVMQGSVFWEGYQYKEVIEKTVKELSEFSANFIKVNHADILGAAKLVA